MSLSDPIEKKAYHAEYGRKWYLAHRELTLARTKANRDPEKHKAYMRQWHMNRKQALLAQRDPEPVKDAHIAIVSIGEVSGQVVPNVISPSIWFANGKWHRKCPMCPRTNSYKFESTVRRNSAQNKPCYVCTERIKRKRYISPKVSTNTLVATKDLLGHVQLPIEVMQAEPAPPQAVHRIEIAHFTVGSVEWVNAVSQNVCNGFTSTTLPKEQHEVYWSTLKRNILSHSGCKTLESVCD